MGISSGWARPRRPDRAARRRWLVPGLAALVGTGLGGVEITGGHPVSGLAAAAVLVAYGLLLAHRSDDAGLATSQQITWHPRGRVHVRAAAMTGDILLAAVVGAMVVEVLRGGQVGTYGWLAGLGAITYALTALILYIGG